MPDNRMLLGDFVAKVTTKIGIKSCIPCKARQAKMNQWHTNTITKLKEKFGGSSAQ